MRKHGTILIGKAKGVSKRHCLIIVSLLSLLLLSEHVAHGEVSGKGSPNKGTSAQAKKSASTSKTANTPLNKAETEALVKKIDEMVSKDFYSESQVKQDWKPALEKLKGGIDAESSVFEISKPINEALGKLQASHTQFVTANDEAFYFMRSLFGRFDPQLAKTEADFVGLGVGGAHAQMNQVRYILDGSPAAAAGFKRGDKIVTIAGVPYTGYDNWYGTAGKAIKVTVTRDGKESVLTIAPAKKDFLDAYNEASSLSARIIDNGKHKIGYYHFWCGGEGSTDTFQSALGEKLADAEALILDLRDGYGGASFEDIDFFFRPKAAFPDMKSVGRRWSRTARQYFDKPLIVLTNLGTRSGKELMSYGLKQSKRAKIMGDRTAGYVLGGRFRTLGKNCALYLAVMNITVDGNRLEGKGVEPDIVITDRLSETDTVLSEAIKQANKELDDGSNKH